MGASGSLLMATIVLESFMPARCWMAPEIPTATYSSGATILPVCPTCMSLGTKPASTAARDAPTAAPILSARSYSILKFSPLFMPRPPEITFFALVSSGRSLLLSSWPSNADSVWSNSAVGASSEAAPAPVKPTASKHVPRTRSTFTASLALSVWTAFPA
uniref:Putative secreted protein n=1 Tax=Ixodes ricinus TaxID=34613 RepID=A0A6B0UYC6_IXORI